MKKIITTAFCVSIMAIGFQSAIAADSANYAKTKNTTSTSVYQNSKQKPPFGQMGEQKHPIMHLEEELNLTDKQKQQAKANRIQGRKEMKPIMDEIRAKKEAILDVIDSDLSKEKQQEKIKSIQEDIKALHKKANEIREKNMANFEKILTKEQKAKFEQIKKEHRPAGGCKQCERRMPPPPPMNDEY